MKRLIIGILLVLSLLGASACAAGGKSAPAPAPAPTPVPAPRPSPAPPERYTDIVQAPPLIAVPAPAPSPAPAGKGGGTSAGYDQSLPDGRMIIRTGNMELVVVDVAAAMERITVLARSYDGFVVSSN